MSILKGALKMGRNMAESRMTETCVVTRDGERVWDEEQGEYILTETVVYTGKCELGESRAGGVDVEAGGQLLAVSEPRLKLPVKAVGVLVGDLVEITGSEVRDELVGRRLKIGRPFDGAQTTALRYRVEVADER